MAFFKELFVVFGVAAVVGLGGVLARDVPQYIEEPLSNEVDWMTGTSEIEAFSGGIYKWTY